MLRVFVKLSLAEMLRQQEAKACLYQGRHVFKELRSMFFTDNLAALLYAG